MGNLSSLIIVFIGLNCILLVVLFFVGRKWWVLRKKTDAGREERSAFLTESITTLSQVMLQNQMESSEACLRLQYLLQQYFDDAPYFGKSELDEFASQLQGMAILEQRKQLGHQERFRQDMRRKELELKYRKSFLELCRYYSLAANLKK